MLNFLATVSQIPTDFGDSLNWIGVVIQWIIGIAGNVGLGIVLFTLVLKVITLPLDIYSKASMRKNSLKMEKMRPQLEKLQKQYQNDQQAYNAKMMEMYKKNGYSFLGACLPMIVTLVIFIVVLNAFSSYSRYTNLEIYREMARAYNAGIVQYGPENYKTNENGERGEGIVTYTCTQNKDGKFDCVRTELFDDETGLFSVTTTQMIVTEAEQSQEQMAALDWSGAQSSAVYTVKTEKVLSSTDEKIVAAVQTAREEDGQQSDENLAANAIRMIGRQAAADRYHENNARFLWVKNIWYPDTSYKHPVIKESEISENYYNELTHYLSAEKSQANGYYILIVISIGTMFLSQFIISKSQKAQNELQTADGRGQKTQKVMLIVMPIVFGIFSFFYSAAFSIYMIVSNIFSILSTLGINFFIDRKFAKIEEQEILEKYNKRIPQSARNPQKGTNGGKTK